MPGSMLSTLTMAMPKRPSIGLLTSPDFNAKAASATSRSTTAVFVTVPRSMSLSFRLRSAAMASNVVPWASLSAAALASSMFGKHDLLQMAALRRLVARLAIGIGLLQIGVRHLDTGGEIVRRQHHERDLAKLRRAEQHLALVEILGEHLGRRVRDVAGLRRAERDVFDAALLVLETVEGVERGLRHRHVAADGAHQLLAERDAALLGQKLLLVVALIAQHRLEPRAVELAVDALEARHLGDLARDLGVADAEPQRPRPLVHARSRR